MNKPVIFLGSNHVLQLHAETCQDLGWTVAGIIDQNYFGNTQSLCDVPVIDTESSFADPAVLDHYKNNYVFFCATNWQPLTDAVNTRNRDKRFKLLDLVRHYNLPCCNIIDPRAKVSSSAVLGTGIYIGEFTTIDPGVKIMDFVSVNGQSHVGHHSVIGENTVLQRQSVVAGDVVVQDNVFLSCNSTLARVGSTVGSFAFIHENLYVKRNILPNEIVSTDQGNTKRIYPADLVVDQKIFNLL
jgi:carbonic anhydrase/acetyltransferase-like protein (isoleucine patch superfamily)